MNDRPEMFIRMPIDATEEEIEEASRAFPEADTQGVWKSPQ